MGPPRGRKRLLSCARAPRLDSKAGRSVPASDQGPIGVLPGGAGGLSGHVFMGSAFDEWRPLAGKRVGRVAGAPSAGQFAALSPSPGGLGRSGLGDRVPSADTGVVLV